MRNPRVMPLLMLTVMLLAFTALAVWSAPTVEPTLAPVPMYGTP
jgi:hypothetical protein